MTTLEAPAQKAQPDGDAVPAGKGEAVPGSDPKQGAISRSITDEQICVLTFDRPNSSANVFNRATLDELDRHLDFITGDERIKGVVITSAKPSIFIAGADLKSFVDS